MIMKMKILLAVLLVVSMGINAGFVYVLMKQSRIVKNPACGWCDMSMRGHYRLTKEQAETLEHSRLEMVSRTAAIKEEMKRHRQALVDLYRRDSIAEPALDSLLSLLVMDQIALEKEVFRHMRDVRDRLDPEQREILYLQLTNELCPAMDAGCGDKCNECPDKIK